MNNKDVQSLHRENFLLIKKIQRAAGELGQLRIAIREKEDLQQKSLEQQKELCKKIYILEGKVTVLLSSKQGDWKKKEATKQVKQIQSMSGSEQDKMLEKLLLIRSKRQQLA